ncbi:hypothetical protein N7447_006040 [Penicillium robsamsonii]|uniref:uncharacterized protein n=1 Tax=Penicillium robsamsonii TaxID=1792511 RepID=UPI0025483F9E|nr:uncharacterized protein N7447_006040 [Penicillium robsamsonii]KAJ5823700.1 hypothetical protein N7447_006040 [Penicillium robsamsonii]
MGQGPIGGYTLPLPSGNGPIKALETVPLDATEYEQILSKPQSVWKTITSESDGDAPFFSHWVSS